LKTALPHFLQTSPDREGDRELSLSQAWCYFLSECSYLVAIVTQTRRNGFDHQVLDPDFAVSAHSLDDRIWDAMQSGRGISTLNRSTNPGL